MKSTLLLIVLFFMNLAIAGDLSDSNKIFDELERIHPESYSPSNVETFIMNGYLVRYYENTNNYLGTKERRVYAYGEKFGGLKYLGSVEKYLMSMQESRLDPKSLNGIDTKNNCLTFNEQFRNINVKQVTIIDSQHNGTLICCRTKISGGQIEEECLDATPWEVQLNHQCPGEWWEQ